MKILGLHDENQCNRVINSVIRKLKHITDSKIPLVAPVTKARFPANDISIIIQRRFQQPKWVR